MLNEGELVFDGDVNEGVSALRDVLEGRRVGELPKPDEDRPIEVTRISLHDGDGRDVESVRSGDPLIIRLHVRAREAMDRWETGFSIDTPLGQMLLAANTERLGITLPAIDAGDGHMDFRIDEVNLGAGQYFINANVSEIIDIDSHILWQGAKFSVLEETTNLGPLAARITAVS